MRFKDNKVWVGVKPWSQEMYFGIPDEQQEWLVKNKKEGSAYIIKDEEVLGRVATIWFTNLDIIKRHEFIDLIEKYSPEKYPKYDNYDAINVNKVLDIPVDYDGVMGVPITFLDKYNPEQFEIIGHEHDLNGDGGRGIVHGQFEVKNKGVYKRILIQKIKGVK